jgi:hypothetical protein
MLPFLLILVVSMTLGLQYSNGLTSVLISNTETQGSVDTSGARSHGSSETKSEEGSATSNTSGTQTDESKNASKPLLTSLGNEKVPPAGGKVLDPGNTSPGGNTVVTVSFNSITVHNKHEGGTWGDGEYNLFAYVQGKQVDLTRKSGPGEGLWDVSNGETLTFNQAYVTKELPDNIPLSIFTIGEEVDRCGRESFGGNREVFFSDPQEVPHWDSMISSWQRLLQSWGIECLTPIPGGFNDALGKIREFYQPPGYGAGPHEVKSSSGDFTLRYSINTDEACNASIC